MKKIAIILVIALSSLGSFAQNKIKKEVNDVTTYYLIRHVEKKTDTKNPGINNMGIKRTEMLLEVFKNVKFDAVYSTDYKRTKQTAKPFADANKVAILAYNPNNMYDEGFKYNTKGKKVLVVGHSNTTPNFANKILGTDTFKPIDETVYGNVYIVTVINDKATGTLLNIN